jgi:hypothetical protein
VSADAAAATERVPADTVAAVSTQLARRALFGFILTFIAARTVVLLIMSRRMPNLYFFLRGTHVHHLNYGIFLLAGVGAYLLFRIPSGKSLRGAALAYGIAMALTFDAITVVAALLGLAAFASAIRTFQSRHLRAFTAILIAVIAFGVVLYDTSIKIGRLEGPRLEALEASSSP